LPAQTLWPRLATAVSWLVPVLFLFPGVGNSLGRGLDPSWAYAVNALPFTDRLPGRDVAFTHGPLGWLFAPADVGRHVLFSLLFWLGMHALFALALARVLRRVDSFSGLSFAGFILLSHMLGLGADSWLVLILGLLLAPELTSAASSRRFPWAPALAAALTVVFGLIKLSLGISAVAFLGSFCLLTFVRRLPGRGRLLAAMAGAMGMALSVAVPLLFGGLGNAWRWLSLQGELARGYAAGMGQPAAPVELAAGLVALALVAGLFLQARANGVSLVGLWAMFLLPVWLAFQHGFIRGDAAHTLAFFPFVLGVAALGLLFARRPAERWATGGAALIFLLLAAGSALRFGVPVVVSRFDLVLGLQGCRNLAAAMDPAALQRSAALAQERALAPSRLPEDFVAPVRAAGLGVDVLPWELSYLPANRLRWVPNPTLQLYATLTRRLDALAARHFAGAVAPDLLLVEGGNIDGRHLFWDTPETWRAILASYELDSRRPKSDVLVLRRSSSPRAWRLEPRGEVVVAAGRWVEVGGAPAESWTFAALDLSLRWRGRLDRWLLGLPPILLETVDDQGLHRTVRILPETTSGGLLLSPSAANLNELAALWSAPADLPRIVRFRITGPGQRDVSTVRVRWLAGKAVPGGEDDSAAVKVCNQEILSESLRRLKDRSIGSDDTGRSVGHQVRGAPCDIGTDDPHAVRCRQGDVGIPGLNDDVVPLRREAVVRGHEQRRRALGGHESRWLGKVGVVADDDSEGQTANPEDRDSVASLVDRPPDRRMQLAIDAYDVSLVKDRCRVVELIRCGNLGEPQDRRYGIACERSENRVELTAFHVDGKFGRACRVVRQTSKDGLRATEDLHSLCFTPANSLANQLDGFHGAAWKKRSLVRGNSHHVLPSIPDRWSSCRPHCPLRILFEQDDIAARYRHLGGENFTSHPGILSQLREGDIAAR
jgi:hypothetical protein